MPFHFQKLEIPDVLLVQPKVFGDSRGFFLEVLQESEFQSQGIPGFVQVNHSRSAKGVLRGLHFQFPPHTQGKLVYVVQGAILDVVVDIRRKSSTYGRWIGVNLDSVAKQMLYVPEGFAHGFCVTTDVAEVIYFCTREYHPVSEGGLAWNDPLLKIVWPTDAPVLSEKDQCYPLFEKFESPFE